MFAKKPQMAKEWAGETPSIKALPEKVKKKHPSNAELLAAPPIRKRK